MHAIGAQKFLRLTNVNMLVTIVARQEVGVEWKYQVKDGNGQLYNAGEWLNEESLQ